MAWQFVLMNLGFIVSAVSEAWQHTPNKPIKGTKLRVEDRKERFIQYGHTGKKDNDIQRDTQDAVLE